MNYTEIAVMIAAVGTLLTGIANLITAIKKKPTEESRKD